jgi:hypothetical protein
MKINPDIKLVSHDIQSYDIPSCHYNILKAHGFDLSEIDKEDKLKRNITIGKMMRANPRITKLLRETTKSLIDEFILNNNIQDSDIVIRQYDGLLLKRAVKNMEIGNMRIEHRNSFDVFISSIKRNMYIAYDSVRGQTKIKGVSHRYEAMDEMYEKICKINFAKKTAIFRSLQRLYDFFMTTEDAELFAIPSDNDRFLFYVVKYGEFEVTRPTIGIMDTSDIDRKRYFDFYLKPFTQSIVLEHVK